MAEQGPVVRVQHADGNIFNMSTREAEKFVSANRGAKNLGRRPAHDDSVPTQREIDATKAQEAASNDAFERDLDGLKKDELVALAEAQGVDASGTKADIIERLDAANGG